MLLSDVSIECRLLLIAPSTNITPWQLMLALESFGQGMAVQMLGKVIFRHHLATNRALGPLFFMIDNNVSCQGVFVKGAWSHPLILHLYNDYDEKDVGLTQSVSNNLEFMIDSEEEEAKMMRMTGADPGGQGPGPP